jgi:ATP-dependent DNA helicase DinG
MADAVARAIDDNRHLVVQAGTGTGKSLAYLVPSILSGKTVVVATATKALQDQLAHKDLPFLQEHLGRKFEFAVLKGRSNYLCMQRLRELGVEGEQMSLEEAELELTSSSRPSVASRLGEQVLRLKEFAGETETGDRAELSFEPEPRAWSLVSVTADECPGARECPSGGECFAERARRAAGEADVVVVNMHLYGAHLASGGVVLPEHDAVVFDEAHELEDIVSESLGVELSGGRLRALGAAARNALGAGRSRAGGGPATAAQTTVEELFSLSEQLDAQLRLRMDKRLAAGPDGELREVLELAAVRVGGLEKLLQAEARSGKSAGAGAGTSAGASTSKDGEQAGAGSDRAARALLAIEHCRSEIQALNSADDDRVIWVEGGDRSPRLRSAPADVAPVMSTLVFERIPVVMTTATVPPGLGPRLGAEPDRIDVIDVGSPFPYEQNALLYCAVHLPDRRRVGDEAVEKLQHDELAALIEAAGGRTLALFTSRRALAKATEALRERITFPILAQDDLPKPALVAEFAADPQTCLFATLSFWQGVDVPGSTLSLVTIDRLPFPRPDDPLMAARRDRAGALAFKTVDLPRAATLLAQGAGRLIRTANDCGVVAVLDPRLATASYRWDLVRALPPMRRTRVRAEAEAFLRAILET